MRVYLGLGSNLGDRRANLVAGIDSLEQAGFATRRISPVVESPALLSPDATPDWNRPFLNLVLEGEVTGTPDRWRTQIKRIENELGRDHVSRWAPRPLDIDILLWGDRQIRTAELTIPHAQMYERAFVLSPMLHLAPRLMPAGGGGRDLVQLTGALTHHIPLWMGIVNLTPDSFSGDDLSPDRPAFDAHIDAMLAAGVHIIDLGAESTRPGATVLTPDEEWQRLEASLRQLIERLDGDRLRPRISVDTRHVAVADKALTLGADLINDVSGLADREMQALVRERDCDTVAMHSLGIPADRAVLLAPDREPIEQLADWLATSLDRWLDAGLDPNRLIVDPGIGFGKDSLQSLKLLRRISELRSAGLRVLVGHSRKSFMNPFTVTPPADRDLETIGASLQLCTQQVDILRVHDVPAHLRAYLAWAHLQAA